MRRCWSWVRPPRKALRLPGWGRRDRPRWADSYAHRRYEPSHHRARNGPPQQKDTLGYGNVPPEFDPRLCSAAERSPTPGRVREVAKTHRVHSLMHAMQFSAQGAPNFPSALRRPLEVVGCGFHDLSLVVLYCGEDEVLDRGFLC